MDLKTFPFSRYGSLLAVSVGQRNDSLVIHDCRCTDDRSRVLSIKIGHAGHAVSDFQNKGSHIEIGAGLGRIWMIDDENLGIEVEGAHVVIEPLHNTPRIHVDEFAYWFNTDAGENPLYVHVRTLEGEAQRHGPIKPSSRNRIQVVVQLNYSDGRVSFPRPNCERQTWLAQMEQRSFIDRWVKGQDPVARAAGYTIWANYVRKSGSYRFDAPLSSKVEGCFFSVLDILFVSGALDDFDFEGSESPLKAMLGETREELLLSQRWRGTKDGAEHEASIPLVSIFLGSLLERKLLSAKDSELVFRFLWKLTDAWIAKTGILKLSSEPSESPFFESGLNSAATMNAPDTVGVSPLVLSLLLFQADLMLKVGQELDLQFHTEVILRLRERLLIVFSNCWREAWLPSMESSQALPTGGACSQILIAALVARRIFDIEDSTITGLLQRVVLPFGIEARCTRSLATDGGSGAAVVPSFNLLIAWMLRESGFLAESADLIGRLRKLLVDQNGGFYASYSGTSGKGFGQPGSTATAAVALLVKGDSGFWE